MIMFFLGGEKLEGRGEANMEGKESGTPLNPGTLEAIEWAT